MRRVIKVILEEVTVLFASILIFRSGWILLDHMPGLSDDAALWIMLVVGTFFLVVSLFLLNKGGAKPVPVTSP